MNVSWMIWDLLAVGVLALFVGRSAAKGLIRTAISFFGFLAAALLAGALSPHIARLIYDQAAREVLLAVIDRQLTAALSGGWEGGDIQSMFPSTLGRLMAGTGGALLNGWFDGDTSELARVLVDSALESPMLALLQGISFFVMFSLALFLVRRIGGLFGGFYKIPVLGTVNTALGGMIGALQGILFLYISAVLLQVLMLLSGNDWPLLNRQVLDSTFIYRVFFHFS